MGLNAVQNNWVTRGRRLPVRLASAGKLAGLTQAELAEKVDISTTFMGQIEAPNVICGISLETLFKLAKALNVTPAKLLGDEG